MQASGVVVASPDFDDGLGHLEAVEDPAVQTLVTSGASDHVVRTVTKNSRTLKFVTQGFEVE